jgi:uncharacterized damage-inducible protein DinB
MTKQYYTELAEYNRWANNIVHSWLDKLGDEQWSCAIVSSFPAISTTALHIAAAETIWLDRVNKVTSPRLLMEMIKSSDRKEVCDAWKSATMGLESFIENFDEAKLGEVVSFKRPDGNTYQLKYFQVFSHVFNHSTYHRGQVVTMLRQVGFTGVHSIDMSTYFWSKNAP